MKKFTLYTYDLWAENTTCNNCGNVIYDADNNCCNEGLSTSYAVNDVYKNETIEAETIEQAEKLLSLKMDVIEIDFEDSNCSYYRYKSGEFSGSPACEIRISKSE
jgi:hypothetical protein